MTQINPTITTPINIFILQFLHHISRSTSVALCSNINAFSLWRIKYILGLKLSVKGLKDWLYCSSILVYCQQCPILSVFKLMDSPSRTRFASPILSILFKLLYFCAISLIFSLACNLSVAYMFNKLHQAHSHNLRWWQDGPVSGKMQRRCDVRGS